MLRNKLIFLSAVAFLLGGVSFLLAEAKENSLTLNPLAPFNGGPPHTL